MIVTLDHIDLNIAAGITMGILGIVAVLLLGRSKRDWSEYFIVALAGFVAAAMLWNHNYIGPTPFNVFAIIYGVIAFIGFVSIVDELGYAGAVKGAMDLLLIVLALTVAAGLARYSKLHGVAWASRIVNVADRGLVWADAALAALLVVVAGVTFAARAVSHFRHRDGST